MNCIVVENSSGEFQGTFLHYLGGLWKHQIPRLARRTLILLHPLVAKMLRLKILQKVNDKVSQILTLEISYVHHPFLNFKICILPTLCSYVSLAVSKWTGVISTSNNRLLFVMELFFFRQKLNFYGNHN